MQGKKSGLKIDFDQTLIH